MITFSLGKYAKIFIVGSLILLIAGGGFLYWGKIKNDNEQKKQEEDKPQKKNYYEIKDETIGVNFRISKRFERMSSTDLRAMNSGFLYGFSTDEDSLVKCYVSQTKRPQSGPVALSVLRDGVFGEIKKNKKDAILDDAQIVEVGENNKGAKLKMSFVDSNQGDIPVIQWEIVGITNSAATFAFCNSPKAVIDMYQADFDLFLDSVRIK